MSHGSEDHHGCQEPREVADPIAILLVSGSLREGSTNTAALRTAQALAPDAVTTVLYDGMEALPHFNPDDDREGEPLHDGVARLRAQIRAADALLLCTPEYAGALPGALKNLLEWTVGDAGTYGKPVAWINASGPAAPTGAADAHESLRKVLGYVGSEVVEAACARVPVTRDAVDADGVISDATIRERIAEALTALARHLAQPAKSAVIPGQGRTLTATSPSQRVFVGRSPRTWAGASTNRAVS